MLRAAVPQVLVSQVLVSQVPRPAVPAAGDAGASGLG